MLVSQERLSVPDTYQSQPCVSRRSVVRAEPDDPLHEEGSSVNRINTDLSAVGYNILYYVYTVFICNI